jgi:hypothetical protein
MEKIIHKLINEFTEGVDTYTHNDSTWLIFTETKQWVIELTENKTLWYNYNFFKSVFAYASLDCVQNQHLITKWVEDNIINKELTYVTLFRDARDRKQQFEDTLENGVKYTKMAHMKTDWSVEDTIENGVKHTICSQQLYCSFVEDTIQNGVKDTQYSEYENQSWINGVIKKGVKETKSDDFNVSQFLCEEVIDKGVKETKQKDRARLILDIDGRGLILETNLVIRDGVKETKISPTHTMDGDWLDGDEKLDEIIKNGVKETNHVDVMKFFDNKMEDTLKNGVKSSIPRQYVGENIIDKIIDKGVIETHREICEYKHTVEHIIQTGVKETKHANKYESIGPVIKEGKINHIIDNGVKVSGTFVGGNRQKENIESVIGYGTKNPTG